MKVASRRRRNSGLAGGTLAVMLVTAGLAAPSAHGAAVGLGSAGSFAGLSGSTVTNTGPSVIDGDLGVSPGTAITGFPPGAVTGTIHAGDTVAADAQDDLGIAYDDAASRSSDAIVSDLAGSTLVAGTYTSATSMLLDGELTLDAEGDPSAVFVFQVGSSLDVGSDSVVRLIGGAQACNVFWQVGSSATIGTYSTMVGTILALTSITLTTGVELEGRALARNGALTLDTNSITKPVCAAPPPAVPPTVSDSTVSTPAGTPVEVQLDGMDATGAPLTYATVVGPSNGTLGPIDQADGTVTYTPDPGFSGTDGFTYTASSVNGTSADGAVTVEVTRPVTGPPNGPNPPAGPTPARPVPQGPGQPANAPPATDSPVTPEPAPAADPAGPAPGGDPASPAPPGNPAGPAPAGDPASPAAPGGPAGAAATGSSGSGTVSGTSGSPTAANDTAAAKARAKARARAQAKARAKTRARARAKARAKARARARRLKQGRQRYRPPARRGSGRGGFTG